jgi:hypothetical protein
MQSRPQRLGFFVLNLFWFAITLEWYDMSVMLPEDSTDSFSFGRYLVMFEKL